MEALGEELYGIIEQVYPELAPKLTGMLMQLGEEECAACLESQEKLAERLDEAFKILDQNGQCAKAPKPDEKRIDPEDGQARTFRELQQLCAGQYSPQEIEEYWRTCQPVNPAGSGSAAKAAPAKAKPSAAPARAAPATAAAAKPAQPAAAPTGPASDDPVPGLTPWLLELKLGAYIKKAAAWIEEQGACNLEEVVENLEDFIEHLGLKPLERKRLEQSGQAAISDALKAAAANHVEAKPVPQASAAQKDIDDARREQEELEREMEELQALEAEAKGRGGKAKAKAPEPAKAKAPSVRVVPKAKAPAISREEVEWARENEKQELEYRKKQQARQAAQEAEAAAQAAEEKREARAREAEERQQRAAAELAAQVAAASPGAAAEGPAEDFPTLGSGDWQAAGKKGRKKR